MKKLLAITLSLAVFLLSGCGGHTAGQRDGRETVTVRILVGDKEAYNQPVNTVLGRVSIPVSGTGMQTITVYIDGSLLKTMNHNFNP